ncbi:MAG: hypothetical protein WBA93_34710 [Microcoleaceae cyanobacterium]
MTKAELESQQQQVMARRPEDLRLLLKGILSNDKRAKDKLSRWLWENPKIGTIVKRYFSQINFGDSKEFYDNSWQETFLRFDNIIQAFLRKNQITLEKLDNISEEQIAELWIRYFNRTHYNKACDLYRQWQRKSHIKGQRIVSLDQAKNDAEGQEYKTVAEEIPDHKNLNDLDDFNLGDLSQETIDNLPFPHGSIDRLRNCARNVDCFEIFILKCQGYKDEQIGKKIGVNQSTVNRNWKNRCLKCINKIIAENNLE